MIEDDPHREFLLARLRQATLQARLIEAELISIGVALKADMIGAESALAWIRDVGLLWMVLPMPDEIAPWARPVEPARLVVESEETRG